MPLQSGVLVTPTPTPTTPPIITEPVGSITAIWTDPTGVDWPLSSVDPDLGWFTTTQIGGWGAAPYEIVTDPLARGGESVRFIRAQPARLTWPLHIWGSTHLEFLQRYRDLRRAFTSTAHRGLPGTLTVLRPDGHGRAIFAYYEDGWGGQPGEDWVYANPVLTLFCPDAYWRDITPTEVVRGFAGTAVPFLNPFPTVSNANVLGTTIVENPGEVVAWPVWTITGPATQVTAINNTTGDSFILTYTLLAGQTATVTTASSTVRDADGVNLVGALNWPSAVLWPLVPGDNEVEATVVGAAAGTEIRLTFYARYEGA